MNKIKYNPLLHAALLSLSIGFVSTAASHPPGLAEDHEYYQGPWLEVEKFDQPDLFKRVDDMLPEPSGMRTASGAPGPEYWQQQVDYEIDVQIDTDNHRIVGTERITYTNNKSRRPQLSLGPT